MVPDSIPEIAVLPGRILLINRRLVEDYEDPAVVAGYALSANAAIADPLSDLLHHAGLLATLKLVTSGSLPQKALRAYAEDLVSTPTALASGDVTLNLLGIESSVHEQIDHDVPRLVTWDLTHELLDLASQEPEHVGNGEAGLVVGGDGNINPIEWGVRVAEGNDWDVHVGSLSQGLVVQAGVANDHESGLKESLGELIGESTWDPLATHVVGTGVCGKLKDGTLSVLTRRDNLTTYNHSKSVSLFIAATWQKLKHDQMLKVD